MTEQLTATVAVPLSKTDPSKVSYEQIPLPPRDKWGDSVPAEMQDEAPAAPAAVVEVAVLDFVTTAHRKSVALKYPFRRDGAVVDHVIVRRLTIGELETLLSGATDLGYMAVYAVMTGLPVAVLRGLIDEDGDAVTDAAYDFLPRSLRTASDD